MKEAFKSLVVSILTAEAAVLLRRKQPKIIAITGSVGKTSTKDAIYAAIRNNSHARKNEKSFNSEIGVPLTVLGLPNGWNNPLAWIWNIIDGFFTAFFSSKYPEVLVLEAGIDRPGDMQKLVRWLKPDVVVLTRLPSVPVHVEYFATPEAVAEEKLKLVSALRTDGTLIHNADDTIIQSKLSDFLQKQIGFSRYLPSDFTAGQDKMVYQDDQPSGVSFTITHGDEVASVEVKNVAGAQHAYAAAAAAAVAHELGISLPDAAEGLHSLKAPNGRLKLIPGIKGTMIIDDTYNASPIAAEHALQTLRELQYAKRKVAVLGDMMELGKFSSDEHRKLGELVPDIADVLLTVGVRSRAIAEGAMAAGMSEKNIFQYDEVGRAGRELQNMLETGDMVLIKASQSVRAERIVEEIMAEPELAPELLVRQDKVWKTIA
tara:strand:- start:6151 stop:7443 length:1293 start_codon:yes stop_codon:yes gene_type:complete